MLELDAEYSETKNFVDFLHDDVYDEDGIMVAEAPKVHSVWAALAIVAMAFKYLDARIILTLCWFFN